ncbi:MAG: TonB-dependent receptor, partial [Alphaproteobacteria bacterium HGW-Alphaproteobacteria-16]
MRRAAWLLTGWMMTAAPAALAYAQDVPAPGQAEDQIPGDSGATIPDDEIEEVVITGAAPRGSVPGDIKPELTLDPADIRAYGVGSIDELLAELEPQTRSGRGRGGGRPVVLLSGRRISGFGEIRDIPPEAIERVEILPEEASLKLGYRADQRVVNIVLRQRFRSITLEAEGTLATAGGRQGYELDFSLLRLNPNGRINIDVEYQRDSRLLESDRDIISSISGQPFDLRGNVTGTLPGGEIDPALSALVGVPVTSAGVPVGADSAAPTVNGFLAAANDPNTTDLAPYRTLQPERQQLSINTVFSRNLGNVTATANFRLEQTQSESLLGLPSASLTLPTGNPFSPFAADTNLFRYYDQFSPLERSANSQTLHGGFSLNGDISTWRWSVTGNWDREENRTLTDTGVDTAFLQARLDAGDPGYNPFGPIPDDAIFVRPADRARSVSNVGSIDALLAGPVAPLPAGDISTSIRMSARTSDLESESLRSGVFSSAQIGRDSGSVQANLDLPIASRNRGVLDAIGNLSLNGNVEVEELSDFGTLVTWGYGANWSPLDGVRIVASFTEEEGAPSAQQLGNPVITTPNVRVFDFVRGETVDITRIDGGNAGLIADNRSVMKLGLNLRPFGNDLSLNIDYNKSVIDNPIAAFPTATAEIEAAFPDRFVRDGAGQLIRIDNRPVNFERSEREQIRWGLNFSKQISSPLARRAAEQAQARRAERQAAREAAQGEGGADGPPPGEGRPERRGPGMDRAAVHAAPAGAALAV